MAGGELTYAAALSNPYIRSILRKYIDDLDWKSDLAKSLIGHFRDKVEPGKIPKLALIRSELCEKYSDDEVEDIVNKVKDFVALPKDDCYSVIKDFESFYANRRLAKELHGDDGSTPDARSIIHNVQNISLIGGNSELLNMQNLSKLDVEEVIQEELGGMDVVPSSFDFVRRASPWGGYIRGQTAMVVSEPGIGKSLFMLNEAVNFSKAGFNVKWIALGDMLKIDFVTRAASLVKKVNYKDVCIAPKKYFDSETREAIKNIDVSILPADTITIYELADALENEIAREEDLDVIIVDYDSNLKQLNENMYHGGREIYNTIAKLTRPKDKPFRLAFVASQPKIGFWGSEQPPKQSAGESSGKQAIVDMMVTIGKAPNIHSKHAGYMTMAKIRRGDEGVYAAYQKRPWGELEEIDDQQYAMMKTATGR